MLPIIYSISSTSSSCTILSPKNSFISSTLNFLYNHHHTHQFFPKSQFQFQFQFQFHHLNFSLINSPQKFQTNPNFKNFPQIIMATCVDTSRAEPTNYRRTNYSDLVSCVPKSQTPPKKYVEEIDQFDDDLWSILVDEAKSDVEQEPILSNYYYNSILSHNCLESALANHLGTKLSSLSLNSNTLFDLFKGILVENKELVSEVKDDLRAVRERDPACISYVHCFLNFKGFLACQSHRIAHKLWTQGRKTLALLVQNRVSEVFAVDIHPGAKIGRGILLDHATGLVIGETAVIGNNVSILHNVTLGGTGKVSGDRHPKIGDGVLIGAGTCVLGNVRVGEGAKIGAGSVVLKDVPAKTTAVGNPARLIGGLHNPKKLDDVPSLTMDHTSHITEWSDYVI